MNQHTCWKFATSLLLLFVCPLLVGGCVRSYSSVKKETVTTLPPVKPDERNVVVSGRMLTLPGGSAAAGQLAAGHLLTEGDVQGLENSIPGAETLLRPRMNVANGDTGRFKLSVTGQSSFVAIEMTPKITNDGRVALRIKIDATSANGTVDTLSEDRLMQPNSGIYQVFGPLKYEGATAYVVLKADVRQG